MLMSRSVQPLALYSGQEYRMLYPIDGATDTKYLSGNTMTMRRVLEVTEIPLPAGTYYLEYEARDVFMRSMLIDRLEFQWDGENLTYPHIDEWVDVP